ncbi:MAG: carbon storage regulator [Lysobacteraceae bacterium]
MLILTRRPGEALRIDGENVSVAVVAVQGDRVRIGVLADRSVPVLREELVKPAPDVRGAPAGRRPIA